MGSRRGQRRAGRPPTVGALARALDLRPLVASAEGLDRLVRAASIERAGALARRKGGAAVSGRLVAFGADELGSFARGAPGAAAIVRRLDRGAGPAALVLTNGRVAPVRLRRVAREKNWPVLGTGLGLALLRRRLPAAFERAAAAEGILHGVLVDIAGVGTLIVGPSGIGKSESALELVERGHRLVADDVVEVRRDGRGVVGRSPPLTRHYMELRGLGIIDVKDLFGPRATLASKRIDLVVRLERWSARKEIERLGLDLEGYPLLGETLPLVRMPVGPGRNLAMLIEVAARNETLRRRGRHAARTLARRLARRIARRPAGREESV